MNLINLFISFLFQTECHLVHLVRFSFSSSSSSSSSSYLSPSSSSSILFLTFAKLCLSCDIYIGSCVEAGYTGCCADPSANCSGSDPYDCYCDVFCYNLEDCCSDIEETCSPRKFAQRIVLHENVFTFYTFFSQSLPTLRDTDTAVIDGKYKITTIA